MVTSEWSCGIRKPRGQPRHNPGLVRTVDSDEREGEVSESRNLAARRRVAGSQRGGRRGGPSWCGMGKCQAASLVLDSRNGRARARHFRVPPIGHS